VQIIAPRDKDFREKLTDFKKTQKQKEIEINIAWQ